MCIRDSATTVAAAITVTVGAVAPSAAVSASASAAPAALLALPRIDGIAGVGEGLDGREDRLGIRPAFGGKVQIAPDRACLLYTSRCV